MTKHLKHKDLWNKSQYLNTVVEVQNEDGYAVCSKLYAACS